MARSSDPSISILSVADPQASLRSHTKNMSGRSYDKLLGKEHEGEALSDPDSLDDSERLTSPRWSTTSRWFQPLKLALAASVVLNVYFVGSTLWSERTPTVRPDISNYGP